MSEIHIPIEALELWRFASTDSSKEHMQWICIETAHPGSVQATATNGTILGRVEWEGAGLDSPLFLKAIDVKTLLKRATKKERLRGGTLTSDGLIVGTMTPQPMCTDYKHTWPNVAAVIPAPGDQHTKVFFVDFLLLGSVLAWAKATARSSRMSFNAPQQNRGPIRIDTTYDRYAPAGLFVLMPCEQPD